MRFESSRRGGDTLHLTMRGRVREEVWAELDAARSQASIRRY